MLVSDVAFWYGLVLIFSHASQCLSLLECHLPMPILKRMQPFHSFSTYCKPKASGVLERIACEQWKKIVGLL